MSAKGLKLEAVPGTYAVCRLDPGADPGPRPAEESLYSVTWTPEETSIVCAFEQAPEEARVEGPFSALRVSGTLDFSLTGVISGLTSELAGTGVSVFAMSTYDTDYLLVPEEMLDRAAEALRDAGNEVSI